jgi:hypothetical protein
MELRFKNCPYHKYPSLCLCKKCSIQCISHPDNMEYRKQQGWIK